jgi:hypothetical protein
MTIKKFQNKEKFIESKHTQESSVRLHSTPTNYKAESTNYRLPINCLVIYLIEIDSYELLPQGNNNNFRIAR